MSRSYGAKNTNDRQHLTPDKPYSNPRRVYSNSVGYTYQPYSYTSPQGSMLNRNISSYHYDSSKVLYAGDWGLQDLICVGSFSDDSENSISLVQPNAYNNLQLELQSETRLTFPPTKIMFEPVGANTNQMQSILTSGDTLRLFNINPESRALELRMKYTKSSQQGSSAPLTSFDWNKNDSNLVITSSVDTTCTLWDLNSQSVRTQLIAHDREVFDVNFISNSTTQFISAGADGSARLFDLRALDNSTIIYEQEHSLVRIGMCPFDNNILYAICQDSNSVMILDIRSMRNPLKVLTGHQLSVNNARWLPPTRSGNRLATAGDDCQILVWDVNTGGIQGAFTESSEINNLLASPNGEFLGAISGKSIQGISTEF